MRTAALNNSTTWTIGAWANTAWMTITDASHSIEFDWQAATGAGANNGSLTFWLDGVQQANLTGLDNDTKRIEFVNLGAMGVMTGTRGATYFDTFESRRTTYIGPASGGVGGQGVLAAPAPSYILRPARKGLWGGRRVERWSATLAPNSEATTTTITYLYDSLYRLKEANYSDGRYFRYTYR